MSNNFEKYYDIFLSNLVMLLKHVKENTGDNLTCNINSSSMLKAIEEKQLDVNKTTQILVKLYTVLSPAYKNIQERNPMIFSLTQEKNGKTSRVTLIPGIDLGEAYNLMSEENKNLVWKYIEFLFYSAVMLLKTTKKETKFSNKMMTYVENLEKTLNFDQVLKKDILDGVGDDKPLSVEDLLHNSKVNNETSTGIGMGFVLNMLGIDKQLNISELMDKLKNISDQDIASAINTMKDLFGADIDEETKDLIHGVLENVQKEMKDIDMSKGDAIQNIFKAAKDVAEKTMPKLNGNKKKGQKLYKAVMKAMKGYTDPSGNKVFNDDSNPLNVLEKMMDDNLNDNGNMDPEEYKKMMKDTLEKNGMGHLDLDKLMNMNEDQLNNMKDDMLNKLKKSKKKK
jgi:hypothetical protein